MDRNLVLRVAAVFSFLSAACIFVMMLAAAGLRGAGGPGPIEFGSSEVLLRLASLSSTAIRVDALALAAPVLGLGAGLGWYHLAAQESRLSAAYGVLLWYVGMILVVTQDALQLALVSHLPQAHASVDEGTRATLEILGASFAAFIRTLVYASQISGVGLVLLCRALRTAAQVPRWLTTVGMIAAVLPVLSQLAVALLPGIPALGLGVPLGILLLTLFWGPAMGTVMWRASRQAQAPSVAR